MTASVTCPGCHLALPSRGFAAPDQYAASGECYQLYHELTFYALAQGGLSFVHQTAVYTYAAQHTGEVSKPITTLFALVGLCLSVEYGYTGRLVQLAHMTLAQQPKQWPQLAPPSISASMTVLDVLLKDDGADQNAALALTRWAAPVWQSWERHHPYIRQVHSPMLGGSLRRHKQKLQNYPLCYDKCA